MNSKIFVSMPMAGKKTEELTPNLELVYKAINSVWTDKKMIPKRPYFKGVFGGNFELVHTIHDGEPNGDGINEPRLLYLSRAIWKLADCNLLILCPGWSKANGCNVEFTAAACYHIPTFEIYLDGDNPKLRQLVN